MYVKRRTGINFALSHATCLHLMSSNGQCLVLGMISSLCSKYMTSGNHYGRLITVGRKELIAYADFGLSWQKVSRICDNGIYHIFVTLFAAITQSLHVP